MKRPEQSLQIALVKLLDAALPTDCVYFAIPNGGYRTKDEARILKAMGTRAGMPDLCFIYRKNAYFIELKSPTGTTSDDQDHMIRRLRSASALVAICKSVDEVLDALRLWNIPLRIAADIRLDRRAA